MYKLLRSILFLFSPEKAHSISMTLLRLGCSLPFSQRLISKIFEGPSQIIECCGLRLKNPVGLGAGFDKNAEYLNELEALGFGFVEIGTVTPRQQPGNDKPRVFRLVRDGGLINRMGFNNDGVDIIAGRLKKWNDQQRKGAGHRMLIAGNIGKNKTTPNEEAWKDYEICFRTLHPYVDFFVVNVSSPNTPGLRALQDRASLHKILTGLQSINTTFPIQRPIFLKIAPDLEWGQIDDVIGLAREIHLDGLVATNTTISRSGLRTPIIDVEAMGPGGLSGRPLRSRATEIVRYIYKQTSGTIPIIASGGIFTGRDAREKMEEGATLVEVWTGFIYEGPFIVKRICKELNQ